MLCVSNSLVHRTQLFLLGLATHYHESYYVCILLIKIVMCSVLNRPMNGMIDCSLGDDGVLSYEDTCSFTCNTGYELTGSDTRTCQSNGSWSGSDTVCSRGNHVFYVEVTLSVVLVNKYRHTYVCSHIILSMTINVS